ncbi:hypothetical protein ACHAW6_014363 [Cyclotella cf. meneghiniana]
MRRIHREGPPSAPSLSPYKPITAPPEKDVPFAEKLRQEAQLAAQTVPTTSSSHTSRRQPINDETHSLLSSGSRSKRKPVVANAAVKAMQQQQQQQTPSYPVVSKSRMRAVLAAFGDCTVKRNDDEKRRRILSCGSAGGDEALADAVSQVREHAVKERIIHWKVLVMTVAALGVFHMGRKIKGRNAALRGQLFPAENDTNSAVWLRENVVDDSEKSALSILDAAIMQPSGVETEKDETTIHNMLNGTLDSSSYNPNHILHHAIFPPHLAHLSNLSIPYNADIETPYFWDVHFSGESVAEAIFSMCHGLVLAAEFGLRQIDYDEENLQVFELDNNKYVNVDTTTPEGIARASRLNLASSHLASIIVSPLLHPMASDIFSPSYPGRMFALFRHPVDRALSMYYYLARASWDPMYNPSLAKMTIEQYAESKYIENNWLTRFLVKKTRGKLTHSDLLLAKKILKFKCLVGLYDEMEASLARFQRYFGWNSDSPEKTGEIVLCRRAIITHGDKVLDHPISIKDEWDAKAEGVIRIGSLPWNAIVRQNKFDMELYEYAKRLFRTQGEEIFNVV